MIHQDYSGDIYQKFNSKQIPKIFSNKVVATENNGIIIVPADKENCTVTMNTDIYFCKLWLIILFISEYRQTIDIN